MFWTKISIFICLIFLITACSKEVVTEEPWEEPDYFTSTEDIKKSYERLNKQNDEQNTKENEENKQVVAGKEKNSKNNIVLKGQDAVFTTDMYLAISEEVFEQFINNVMQNNTNATERMAEKGELIFIPKGTEVYVIDRTIAGKAKVEVIGTGLVGFIVADVLESIN